MTILKALLKFTTLFVFLFSNYFDSLEASTLYPNTSHVNVVRCIEKERRALLKFKDSAEDSSGMLSSWSGLDCCTWKGVSCRHPTGEVVELHLAGNWSGDSPVCLSGKVSYHLNELTHLRYLNLSDNYFSGMIPPQLGNLSNLLVLDLRYVGDDTFVYDLNWISSLSSLKYLGLSLVNVSLAKTHWLQAINVIPSLEVLRMSDCNLDTIPLSLSKFNLTSLSVLDLVGNFFNSPVPQYLSNLSTNLEVLYLSGCGFTGPIFNLEQLKSLRILDLNGNSISGPLPTFIGNLSKLEFLDLGSNRMNGRITRLSESLRFIGLSNNSISGPLPTNIGKLSKLEFLDLSSNKMNGSIPKSLGRLTESLRTLKLSYNSISGPFPTFIGKLSKLEFLDLSYNKMNGSIPKSLGRLTELEYLYVTGNEWEGMLSQDHFENLSKLTSLWISSGVGLVLNVSFNWVPPFSLTEMNIINCDAGPKFPKWLQTQTQLKEIVLQNASISDTIPDWFWKLSPHLDILKLSDNQLQGSIPFNIGQMMPSVDYFDLSINSLNGSIPLSLLKIQTLSELRLHNNHLSGKIHDEWSNGKIYLQSIDFSNNNLSGKFPSSLFSLPNIRELKLSNNSIMGELPIPLTTSYKNLRLIDLGDNKLSGSISEWIGEGFTSLIELRMRGNMFNGRITEQYCRLQSLQVLDLAQNNLSGPIPPCLSKLSAMYSINSIDPYIWLGMDLNLKGYKYTYEHSILPLVRAIDLSCNHLSGIIPENITNLKGLGTLNLSNNHLTGKIPSRMGEMLNLETLDLSSNQIYGQIPPSISSITTLSHLNLSHNNLSGLIPSGTQLSTFDKTIYEGNSGLCGSPLSKCGLLVVQNNPGEDDTNNKDGKLGLYVSVALGFVFGFWSICGTLVVKKSWRRAYFGVIEKIIDRIALILAMNSNRFNKMIAKKGSN